MIMPGYKIELLQYESKENYYNKQFKEYVGSYLDYVYLPPFFKNLSNINPIKSINFIPDDNRSGILEEPIAKINGMDFHLSVKGIGSVIDPYNQHVLTPPNIIEAITNHELREKILKIDSNADRLITNELWLRGSPYGGQGIEHAQTALNISEMAEIDNLNGFLIAPVINVSVLPDDISNVIKNIYWYRKYPGIIVQEKRLVPSNIRLYFHSTNAIGTNASYVYDMLNISNKEQALEIEKNFIKSGMASLTLYARTLEYDGTFYKGLDYYDVWLDKDAVLSPNGSIYFVDLEGIEPVKLTLEGAREKIEDQFYRGMYEFMYAYERISQERRARFGYFGNNKRQDMVYVFKEALYKDPIIEFSNIGIEELQINIKNNMNQEKLYIRIPIVN